MSRPGVRAHTGRRALAVAATLAALLAACSDDDAGSSTTAAPASSVAEPTTAASTTTGAAAGEMSGADRAAVNAAIQAGLERVTSVAPWIAPPGLWVGVWDPAKGAYLTAQGEAAAGQPATVEDHYRIGSTTKTFTGAVILQLVEEGKLSLDQTVGELLPDLAAAHPELTDITVESLLTMTSGIEDYLNIPGGVVADIVEDPAKVWTPEELIAAAVAAGVKPQGTPGYSTTNYLILQLIAEELDAKPLPDIIEARLTGPLGMTESSLPIADPAMPEPFAAGHLNLGCVDELTNDGATGVTTSLDPTDWSISFAQGGGGMTSTLADLGRWAASNSGTSLLGEELQQQRLASPTVEFEGPPPYLYGLGWYELGDGWFGHDGEAIGWQSTALHNPTTGVSVAMAANTCSGESAVFWSILNELYPDEQVDSYLTSALAG